MRGSEGSTATPALTGPNGKARDWGDRTEGKARAQFGPRNEKVTIGDQWFGAWTKKWTKKGELNGLGLQHVFNHIEPGSFGIKRRWFKPAGLARLRYLRIERVRPSLVHEASIVSELETLFVAGLYRQCNHCFFEFGS